MLPADQRFLVRDEATGAPVANRLYRLSYLGGLVQGRTDAQGYTEFVSGTAFREAGIAHVSAGLTNTASRLFGRTGSLIDAARAGTLIRYRDDSEWVIASGMTEAASQFNLIGYSSGSLLAAQTARWYARQAHVVDHVVLIASPIDADFLNELRKHKCIRKVIVVDLTEFGDPIHAKISQFELMKAAPKLQNQKDRNQGDGHFYYAHLVRGSNLRWAALAKRLFAEGLR